MACQLDYLCKLISDRQRREALKNLPPNLDETYQRILENIHEGQAETVIMTLNMIAYSQRNLSIEQVREALSAPSDGSLLEKDDYIPLEEVLFCCSSFIRKSADGDHLEFAHASVLQYLESTILRGSNLSRFHLSRESGNRMLARKCLEFIHLENFNKQYSDSESQLQLIDEWKDSFSFLFHACWWWTRYAEPVMDDEWIQSLARKLFNPTKTGAYTSWVTVLFRSIASLLPDSRAEAEAVADATSRLLGFVMGIAPLDMAALVALPEICGFLTSKFKISVTFTTLSLASYGPIMLADLFMSGNSERKYAPAAIAVAAYKGIEMRTCFKRIQRTIQVLMATSSANTTLSADEFDKILVSILDRCEYENGIFLALAAEFVIQTIKLFQENTASLPKFCEKLPEYLENSLRYGLPLGTKQKQLFDTEFGGVVQQLAPLTHENALAADLCSTIWPIALDLDLDFIKDPLFVDTQVSLSTDGLVDALFAAVRTRGLYFLEHAIQDPRVDISRLVKEDLSLLETAVENNFLAGVKLFLGAGCSALPRASNQGGPMHVWAAKEVDFPSEVDYESILQLLLNNGASPSTQDRSGNTVWHIACRRIVSLRHLIRATDTRKAAACLSTINKDGDSALACAFQSGNEDCVLALLSLEGIGPTHFQSTAPIFTLAARLGSHVVTQKLMDLQWDSFLPDNCLLCPLHSLDRGITFQCLMHLERLYGSTCYSRCGELLSIGFMKSWLTDSSFDRSNNLGFGHSASKVLEHLYVMDKVGMAADNPVHIWDGFVSLLGLFDDPQRLPYWADKIVEEIIVSLQDCGILGAYEAATGHSCLTPIFPELLDTSESASVFHPDGSKNRCRGIYGPITPKSWFNLMQWTSHWPELGASASFVSFFRITLAGSNDSSGSWAIAQSMLKRGIDVHLRIQGYSTLEIVCLEQRIHPDLLGQIIDAADPARLNEIHGPSGEGPLHMLFHKNGKDTASMVEKLLRGGADPNLRLGKGNRDTPILLFLNEGMHEAACALLRGNANPALRCAEGLDAALRAVLSNDALFLEKLADWEFDIGSRSIRWDMVPSHPVYLRQAWDKQMERDVNGLHIGAALGHNDVVRFYLDRNLIDIRSTSFVRGTPLHYAALSKTEDVVRLLIDRGAPMNVFDSFREIPLHWAVRGENVRMVKTLLMLRSPQTKNGAGLTPRQLAVQQGCQDVIECFNSFKEATELDDREDAAGFTGKEGLLCRAIQQRNIGNVQRLFDSGLPIDVRISSRDGETPLFIAIDENSGSIIQYLLGKGASLGDPGRGETALEWAIHRGASRSTYFVLLDRYIQVQTAWWMKPWDLLRIAAGTGNVTALEAIIQHLQNNAGAYA